MPKVKFYWSITDNGRVLDNDEKINIMTKKSPKSSNCHHK